MNLERLYKKVDAALTKCPVIGPHWQTTLAGWLVAGAIAGEAFIEAHDYRDPKFYVKLASAVGAAIWGKVSADAKRAINSELPK